MPKSNKPPKYSKNGKYAIVYVNGKKIYLGLYGSTESRQEYARVVAEWQFQPIPQLANCESNVSVSELVAGFLDYSKSRQDEIQYRHNKYAIGYYTPNSHKTEQYIGDKIIPLGKPEQELIAPYLEGKNPEDVVFSPRTAMQEHAIERRLERKYPMTPSQAERNQERARNPKRTLNEFYDQSSYRNAVEHAIKKVNKGLPDEEKVPHWTPYQLRHLQATALKKNKDAGRILTQAALAHTSPETTDIYIDDTDEQLIIREILAMERKNPFESAE